MRGGRDPLSSLFTSSASRRKDNLQELERAKRQEHEQQQQHEEGAPGGRANHKGHTPDTSSSTGTTFNQRKDYEKRYPPLDTARIRSFVAGLRETSMDVGIRATAVEHLQFDPFDCPTQPPPHYPLHYPLVDLLTEWPVDNLQWPSWEEQQRQQQQDPEEGLPKTTDHPYLYQSLCIFDWDKVEHRERMRAYQMDFDLPFIVRNNPEFLATAERWMRDEPDYLRRLIGEAPQRTEHASHTNQLPFWRLGKSPAPPGWTPPTENVEMTFDEWYQHSVDLDQAIAAGQDHSTLDHWYFRLNGDLRGMNAYLFDELPAFNPLLTLESNENLFMMDPDSARGINCRLGMAGNVAAAHYDNSRNWIVLFGGQRRYVLSHPGQCDNLALEKAPHPSARHSWPNWSEIGKTPDSVAAKELAKAQATQVVLQASDALFLPTNYFHFIVSLNRNYQCNARSGRTDTYDSFISDCGLPTG